MTDSNDELLALRKLVDYYQEKRDREKKNPYIDNSGIPPVYPHVQDRVETRSIVPFVDLADFIPRGISFERACNIFLDRISAEFSLPKGDRDWETWFLAQIQPLIFEETSPSLPTTLSLYSKDREQLLQAIFPQTESNRYAIAQAKQWEKSVGLFSANLSLFTFYCNKKINFILNQYRSDERESRKIVCSPIAVIIWYFLDKDKFRLSDVWQNVFESRSDLDLLSTIFGEYCP